MRPRRRILLSSIALLFFLPAVARAFPAHQIQSQKIRVRLTDGATSVTIRGMDLQIFESGAITRALAGTSRQSEWEFHCEDGRIRASRIFPEQGRQNLELHEPAVIQSPSGFLQINGRPYRDGMRIYSNGSFCEVVNEVDIEKYLEGLVNAEFNSRWNEDAMEAQVVAARTYATYQKKQAEAHHAHFDVDATDRDQVYDGSIREDFRAARAVTRTRGMVLTVRDAGKIEPLKAYYSSTCGGITELPQNVWGKGSPGFSHPVDCPYCAGAPRFHWDVTLTAPEITAALLRGTRLSGMPSGWPRGSLEWLQRGKLIGLRSTRFLGGRVEELTAVITLGANSRELRFSGAKFRDWLGAVRVRSTAFELHPSLGLQGAMWRLTGRGYGHGVGMCQYGAKAMGEKGFTMAAILKHYYPDARLQKMW